MRYHLLIVLSILMGCSPQKSDLKITYLANCGFLYETQSSKVIIDPFGTEYGNFFYLPTSETRFNLENGNSPFDNLDLVLITHIHGDHFNPFLAEKFLQVNKNTQMICPPQVLDQIRDSCVDFKQIESQIICPRLSMNNLKIFNLKDISVTAVRMQHGSDRSLERVKYADYTDYERTENFGYLIDFKTKVIFHQGDAALKFNKLALNKLNRKIDVAYLSFFDWDSTSYNLLNKNLQAENIIFMHETKPGKEFETEEFKIIEPKLIFFKKELESRLFK